MLLFNSRNWNIIAPFIFNSVATVHLSMSNCNNKAFARYRSVRVTGAVKFAETIGVRAARRGAARRVERRSQTGSFVLATLIGSHGAHAPLAISILIKVADSFSVVCAGDELRLPR